MPDITTIAVCSTALGAIMCIAILLSWVKDGRPDKRSWLFAPFGLSVPAGVLLTYPELLPGPWGLQIGWFMLTLVYGAAWLCARVACGRKPLPLAVLLPCSAMLLFTCTVGEAMPGLRMLPRTLLFAAFNGLAAYEFSKIRSPRLPSATTLYWVFTAFFAFDVVRSPFSLFLPAPFGPGETQVWSIALFNFLIVMEGLLLGVFVTALGKEQIAERHYHLASTDPLSGIGNRRALKDRIAILAKDMAAGKRVAVAVLDIDKFKGINDRLGHVFGDTVIAGTAQIAKEVFGEHNVFRVGGEEFAAIIVAEAEDQFMAKAEEMRTRFAAFQHSQGSNQETCTISIGLAHLESVYEHVAAFTAADRALYMAKRLGRNQTLMLDAAAPESSQEYAALRA